MKREIEVKARVSDLGEIRKKLEELGYQFREPIEQDDMVFVNYDGDFTVYPDGTNFLRIRKTKGKSYFTLKQGRELASIEREVEISDPEQMKDALMYMGYHEAVRVEKK